MAINAALTLEAACSNRPSVVTYFRFYVNLLLSLSLPLSIVIVCVQLTSHEISNLSPLADLTELAQISAEFETTAIP